MDMRVVAEKGKWAKSVETVAESSTSSRAMQAARLGTPVEPSASGTPAETVFTLAKSSATVEMF